MTIIQEHPVEKRPPLIATKSTSRTLILIDHGYEIFLAPALTKHPSCSRRVPRITYCLATACHTSHIANFAMRICVFFPLPKELNGVRFHQQKKIMGFALAARDVDPCIEVSGSRLIDRVFTSQTTMAMSDAAGLDYGEFCIFGSSSTCAEISAPCAYDAHSFPRGGGYVFRWNVSIAATRLP